jgi:hypothetical protein
MGLAARLERERGRVEEVITCALLPGVSGRRTAGVVEGEGSAGAGLDMADLGLGACLPTCAIAIGIP